MSIDPVANFKRAQKQLGTVAFQRNEEHKILKRLNKQPLVAAIWSFYFPGGGFFYLNKPLIGILHIILIFVLAALIAASGALDAVNKFLAIIGVLFGVECISFVITLIVASVMHSNAERDWEEYQQLKQQQHQQEQPPTR